MRASIEARRVISPHLLAPAGAAINEDAQNMDLSLVKDYPLYALGTMTQGGFGLLAGFLDGIGDLNTIYKYGEAVEKNPRTAAIGKWLAGQDIYTRGFVMLLKAHPDKGAAEFFILVDSIIKDYEDSHIQQLAIGGDTEGVEHVSSITEMELTRRVASAIDNTPGYSHLKHLRPKVEQRSAAFAVGSKAGYNVGTLPETARRAAKKGNIQRSLERGLHALGYIMSLYQDYYDAQARGNAMYRYIYT